jgi:hypothetical protein
MLRLKVHTHHEMHMAGMASLSCSPTYKKNDILSKQVAWKLISVLYFCGVRWHRLYDSGRMGCHGVPTGSALKP